MFTGIIKNTSKLEQVINKSKNYTFILSSDLNLSRKDIGTSISIDGVCLTLVKIVKFNKLKKLYFNISPETLNVSSLKYKKKGDILNLEKSLKYGDEIAGHFVQGHIDDIGIILSKQIYENSWSFWIKVKKKFSKFLIKKGSVSVNGVSLTINEIKNTKFKIDVIPHTFRETNIKFLKKDMIVNIEFDLVIKFLRK
tara:strand:+ start:13508 stop:14095 length:588 start_codon:yes stop_codon:yes gene_type:complete